LKEYTIIPSRLTQEFAKWSIFWEADLLPFNC
jgi:hypothetical protein